MANIDLPGVRADYTFTLQPGAGIVFTYPPSAGRLAGQRGSFIGYDGVRFRGDVWTFDLKTAVLTPPATIPAPASPTTAALKAAYLKALAALQELGAAIIR